MFFKTETTIYPLTVYTRALHPLYIMDLLDCAMHISYKKEWKQGQKLFKKESDVGMLLTGIQSTETRCM